MIRTSAARVIPCAAQRGSDVPHARHANKIPDQRRGISRRIASGMTAYDRNPLPLAGEGGALAPGEGKSFFAKKMRKDSDLENPLTPGPSPVYGRGEKRNKSPHPEAPLRSKGLEGRGVFILRGFRCAKAPQDEASVEEDRLIARRPASGITAPSLFVRRAIHSRVFTLLVSPQLDRV